MDKKWLLALLVFVFVAGVGGFFAFKGGTSSSKQNSFEALPEYIKNQYVKKDDLQKYGNYITPKSYSQTYTSLEDDLSGLSGEALRAKASELSRKNLALIADNLDLADKNLELISKFESIAKRFDSKKEEILQSSSETITKTQQQHEESLKAMSDKIADKDSQIQKIIQGYDERIEKMRQQMQDLQNQKQLSETQLQEQIEQAKNQTEQKASSLLEANDMIAKLQAAINESEKENSELKSMVEGADEEVRKSTELFTKELSRINDGFAAQKKALEDALSKKSNELLDVKEQLKNTKDELKVSKKQNSDDVLAIKNLNQNILELKAQNSKLSTLLSETTSSLNETRLNLAKTSRELNASTSSSTKLKGELEKSAIAYINLEKQNEKLTIDLLALRSDNHELNETIRLKNQSIQSQAENLQKQDSKMIELTAKNDALNVNVKELKAELDKAQNTVRQYRQNYEGTLKKLDEQILVNENLHQKLMLDASLSKMGQNINESIDSLSMFLRSFSKPKDERKASAKSDEKLAQKEIVRPSTPDAIEEMLNRQDELEDENKNLRLMLDAATHMETPKKLVFVSKISCTDLGSKNSISSRCKAKVAEFLGRYNSNYIFEIVPIVDERSSALTKAATKDLKADDAKIIEDYANYGVGRMRAQAASQLILDEYGDFARISYSPELILRSDARGFEIRAYK